MKKKTMLVIGIMGILFAVGATSVAMAQITVVMNVLLK
ncbi:hypothetical protein METP2_02391 [Methanosarcinales archaeon]|nr:hypothetical protein METP2_02391 [Methanosarcinales archaeon]